ncbi:D-alanyl-D-alanine carboxypeptidase [Streptomyces canus]|uniref:D-alanyl-D-alanine carboxypeptidase n=1 Tax=Streptomyces canus TaxID=58343 RepID=UPI0036C6645D
MAGESPDRSKQRESSAEPTSGSASPVPGARSSAPDPRLAVARESISLRRLDTATRVFSVRDLPKAPENPAEAGTDGSGTGEPEDAPPATEERPEATEGASTAEGSQDSGATEGSDEIGTGEDSGDADTEDSGTAESPDDDEPGDSGTAEGSEDSSAAETPDDPDDEPAGVGDARLRDAVAAWVATADGDGSGKAEADGEPEADADESAPSGARGTTRPTPTDPQPDDEPADAAPTDPKTEDDEPTDAPPVDRPTAATADGDGSGKPAVGTQTDSEPEADADEAAPSGARGTARPAPTDPQPDDEPADAAPTDQPTATTADGDGSSKPAAGAETDGEPEADADESAPSGARGTTRPAPTDPQTDDEPADAAPTDPKTEDDEPADERPVDQPTAVFKAPRPAVDQPTTMLKLGKAPEAEPKEPAPKPEADAERTSRFVALKALDEPRPKPDVTAAVPQVGPERTTQQPLPPKPPLDLLAELTNTPPPPPSPLRTLGRRVKIWTPILILLVVVFAIAQSLRPLPSPTLSLTAEDSYTFDGSKVTLPWPTEGQGWMDVNGIGTMGDFGKQTPVAIGSVAKAMTAYIVLKDHPLKSGEEGAKITVDALAEKEGGYNKDGESTLNTVKNGDVLTQRQAIAAIMIPSANNIARLLARWDSGSEAAFIKKMNDTAKELGMKNTTYTDASGLKETTVSTAEDQVKLGNELVKIPALMEITSMGQWIDPSGHKWYNYNYLVPYNGAIGIKTGTTSAAGGNLLFAARKDVGGETVTVVGAILGQHKSPIITTVNDVSRVAMRAARDELTSAKILKKGDVVGYVDDGLGGHTPVVLTKDVTAVGWAGFKVKLSFAADDVPHTAKAGTKVGTLTVGDGEGGAVKVPVTLQKDLTEPGLTDKLTRVG